MHKILLLIIICSLSMGSYQQVLKTSWGHYKKEKVEINGRPLADKDRSNISLGSEGMDLTYSESVSYVLFRSVLMNDKKTFDETWKWSVNNLMRKNINKVFNWEASRWEKMPEEKKDYLFAWRYTPNIKKTNIGGVIYVPEKAMSTYGWRNGLDVAPDGDQLIAGALIMAHNKWGSKSGDLDYLFYAKHIVADVWTKCVSARSNGLLDDFESQSSVDKWFTYNDKNGRLMKSIELEDGDKYLSLDTNGVDWYGVGKYLGSADFSEVNSIVFYTKSNAGVQIILEDKEGHKFIVDKRYESTSVLSEVKVNFSKNLNDDFNWAQVKNLMFQPLDESFCLDNVRLVSQGVDKKKSYYLLSNDRGDPWINFSYYMPFLYSAFASLDPCHAWLDLQKDSLAQIQESKYAVLKNNKGQVFKGIGALVPDWCMLDIDNKMVDLPWGKDGVTDGYLQSWDAFRTWYFLGLTFAMFPDLNMDGAFKEKTYEFYKNKLAMENKLTGGYAIDGTCPLIRGIQYEYASSYGVYLAYFSAMGDKENSQKVLERLVSMYNKHGYWGDSPNDYYKQNWAWLGLDFYVNKGENVANLLRIDKSVAMIN